MYQISLTGHGLVDVDQSINCVNTSCVMFFTDFAVSTEEYNLTTVATNSFHVLREFRMTIARDSGHYLVVKLNSTNSCQQQLHVQCGAGLQTSFTSCDIRYTTYETSNKFSVPLNTQLHLPYTNPGTAHQVEFSATVNDYLLIRNKVTANTNESPSKPAQETKTVIILFITSLYILLVLIQFILISLGAFRKATILNAKKEADILSAVMLLVLALMCTALLVAFGITTNDTCNSSWETLQNRVLDIMIVIACVGILFVMLFWVLKAYRFYKHQRPSDPTSDTNEPLEAPEYEKDIELQSNQAYGQAQF